MHTETGGPVIYGNEKIKRKRYQASTLSKQNVNHTVEPEPIDIVRLNQKLLMHLFIIIMSYALIALVFL
jgi:hypothetical protein